MRMRNGLRHSIFWVFTLLLIFSVSKGYAQIPPSNTGDDPYLGTTHRYQVTADDLNNTREWFITDGTTRIDPTAGIFVISSGAGNILYADVTFTAPPFSVGTWILTYVETSTSTGTCVATREFVIHLRDNTFYEVVYNQTTENPGVSYSECHDSTGTVQDWDEVSTTSFQTAISFPVYMNKEADFALNTWEFDAQVSIASIGYNVLSIGKGAATSNRGANYTVTLVSGDSYKVVVNAPQAGDTQDFVDIRVVVEGPMYATIGVTLTISNGLARSGVNREVVTTDNITVYPTDGTYTKNQWREKTVEMLGVPATHNIFPGAGETATSASNPLQYSTHRYVVQMGDKANNSANTGTGWYIEEADGDPVANNVANYVLAHYGSSPTNDTISIRYNMAPGEYVIYFAEVGDNGCSTIRSFPISLGDPFDADILTVADQCSGANGVIFQNLQDSTTTVNYTIRLNTSSYGSSWRFNFALSPTPAFANPDMEVQSVTPSPAGVTYNNGTGLVTVPSTVQEVTMKVVYNGQYINNHDLQAILTNITGSFNEIDADATNTITHIIHAMPQAGTLAGID